MADRLTLTRYDITDLNNGKIADFPVTDPPGWDDISLFYAKALQTMGYQDPPGPDTPIGPRNVPDVSSGWKFSERPDSYFFWGAMHWWPGKSGEFWSANPPAPINERWCHCTHGPATVEQFFLPWHRIYIYYYEQIIRAAVAKLGGPDKWALPYWNYSFPGTGGETWPRSNLPWAFCQENLPDGSSNPLFISDTKRRGLQPTWPGGPDAGQTMFLETTTPYYDQAYAQTDWFSFNKTLDQQPHGMVHVDTGSGDQLVSSTGWMRYTQTAGFDPIFWLHHSEIDRFWVGWNDKGGKNPDRRSWLDASEDPFVKTRWNFWANGNIKDVIVVHPGEMLQPDALEPGKFPYSYVYQNLPEVPPPVTANTVRDAAAPANLAGPEDARNEVAATDEPVQLGKEKVTARISLPGEAPRRLVPEEVEEPKRVILQLDGIVAEGPPGNYEVYFNNTEVDRTTAGGVPQFVGVLSGFGADHEHGDGGDHEGSHGLSASFDITELVGQQRSEGRLDEPAATVTFVPAARPREGLELQVGTVHVAKVSIRTE